MARKKIVKKITKKSTKSKQETRAAIREYADADKQRKILEASLRGNRGYVTTNYKVAKRKRSEAVSPEEFALQQKVLQALEQTSKYLAVETDITKILEKIAKTIALALGAKQATFWDFTSDRKGAHIMASYGMQKQYIEHSLKDPLPIGGAWLGRAMQTGQAWATSDIQKDPVLPKSWLPAVKKQNYHGLLCTPLMKEDKIIGGMCVYHKDPHEYQYFEINIMTIVANQAATALQNARIFQDLESERIKTLSIVQSLNDAVITYGLDFKISHLNQRAEEILWIQAKDLVGKLVNDISFAKKNQFFKNLYSINQILSKQPEYMPVEFTTEGPHKVALKMVRVPVRDAENIRIGSMYILTDITHEKEVEELKVNFASTASHQLRTPLTGLKWSLDSIKSEIFPSMSNDHKKMLLDAYDITNRLINMVNDLLDVSRIEEGRFGYNFQNLDVQDPLKKMFKSLRSLAQKRNIDFTLENGQDPCILKIDLEKFNIVIQNVMDNAIKYSNEGGKVVVKLQKREHSVEIVVEDNGIGIPKDEQKLIFNKFYRARNAIHFHTEGSGLGLYMAKNIVEKHHGSIGFISKENEGSTFTITLPVYGK